MEAAGRILLVSAVVLGLVGGLLLLLSRLGLTGLPGDILVRGRHVTLYVPLGLCLLLSVILTLAANLFFRR